MNLKNAHIIITGGSSGIGKQTAKQCVELGAKVVITGRNSEKLKVVANEIGAIPFTFNINEIDNIILKTKEIAKILDNKVDILINNAGIGGNFDTLGNINIKDFENVFSTNVFGLAIFTQELLPIFKKQQSGTIINVASTAGVKGFARGTVYAASKFALRGMTQCWQQELRRDNIRVCLINPSAVTTAFGNEERTESPEEQNKLRSKEIADTIISVIQMDNRGFIPEVTIWATNPF